MIGRSWWTDIFRNTHDTNDQTKAIIYSMLSFRVKWLWIAHIEWNPWIRKHIFIFKTTHIINCWFISGHLAQMMPTSVRETLLWFVAWDLVKVDEETLLCRSSFSKPDLDDGIECGVSRGGGVEELESSFGFWAPKSICTCSCTESMMGPCISAMVVLFFL